MLGRLVTHVSLRHWTIAAAGLALVVVMTIATAPRTRCHCAGRSARPPTTSVAVPQVRQVAPEARWTRAEYEIRLAYAKQGSQPARRTYLTLMSARSAGVDGVDAAEIDGELRQIAARAGAAFLVWKDYENAASALLMAESLHGDERLVRILREDYPELRR